MPWAAVCKRCKKPLIGDYLINMTVGLHDHFKEIHNEDLPYSNLPNDMNDCDIHKEINLSDNGEWWWKSNQFESKDVWIGVITNSHKKSCEYWLKEEGEAGILKILELYQYYEE